MLQGVPPKPGAGLGVVLFSGFPQARQVALTLEPERHALADEHLHCVHECVQD